MKHLSTFLAFFLTIISTLWKNVNFSYAIISDLINFQDVDTVKQNKLNFEYNQKGTSYKANHSCINVSFVKALS